MNEENIKKEEEYLFGTAEGFSEYLSDVLKGNNYPMVKDATARAVSQQTIEKVATAAKVTRSSLYRGYFVEGEPTLQNFLSVLDALGVELTAAPKTVASR
tara:strand:+ start:565 stop:864 length:300 start_codon:yes stop_codon:yes gene_type:complete